MCVVLRISVSANMVVEAHAVVFSAYTSDGGSPLRTGRHDSGWRRDKRRMTKGFVYKELLAAAISLEKVGGGIGDEEV